MIKIIKSLAMIGIVAATGLAMTDAYFSDTETSGGNTMAAGSLDLTLNEQNGGVADAVVTIEDMKPSETKYSEIITLHIDNNPGRVYKKIVPEITCNTGAMTEPECDAEGGTWTLNSSDGTYDCVNPTVVDDYLPTITWFDLEIWIGTGTATQGAPICGTKDTADNPIETDCWDIIIPDEKITVEQIAGRQIFLGGVDGTYPDGSTIILRQSFHMKSTAGNKFQGDSCAFTEEFMVIQINDDATPDEVCTPSPEGCVEG